MVQRASEASPSNPPLSTILRGERVALRPPRSNDLAALRRTLRRNAEHLRPWSPAPRPGEEPTSITEVSKTIMRERREWTRGAAYSFFIVPPDIPRDAPIMGRIGLSGVVRGAFQNAFLGYWMANEWAGTGLMTEAVNLTVDFAFRALHLHRVQAAVMPRNLASLRVLEKIGFRREGLAERYLKIAGVWEDHIIFATTADER